MFYLSLYNISIVSLRIFRAIQDVRRRRWSLTNHHPEQAKKAAGERANDYLRSVTPGAVSSILIRPGHDKQLGNSTERRRPLLGCLLSPFNFHCRCPCLIPIVLLHGEFAHRQLLLLIQFFQLSLSLTFREGGWQGGERLEEIVEERWKFLLLCHPRLKQHVRKRISYVVSQGRQERRRDRRASDSGRAWCTVKYVWGSKVGPDFNSNL